MSWFVILSGLSALVLLGVHIVAAIYCLLMVPGRPGKLAAAGFGTISASLLLGSLFPFLFSGVRSYLTVLLVGNVLSFVIGLVGLGLLVAAYLATRNVRPAGGWAPTATPAQD